MRPAPAFFLCLLAAACSAPGPPAPGVLESRGRDALDEGRPSDAVRDFEAATRTAPRSFTSWIGLARAAALTGDQPLFARAILTATPLAPPGEAWALEAIGTTYLAATGAFRRLREREMYARLALTHMRGVMALDPGFPRAFYHLGLAQFHVSDLAAARHAAALALEVEPGFAGAQVLYGRVLLALGETGVLEALVTRLEKSGDLSEDLRSLVSEARRSAAGPESRSRED